MSWRNNTYQNYDANDNPFLSKNAKKAKQNYDANDNPFLSKNAKKAKQIAEFPYINNEIKWEHFKEAQPSTSSKDFQREPIKMIDFDRRLRKLSIRPHSSNSFDKIEWEDVKGAFDRRSRRPVQSIRPQSCSSLDKIELEAVKKATNLGIRYEELILTHMAIKLALNKSIKHFSLLTNAKDFGNLDDVVIHLEYENEPYLFVCQVKHKDERKSSVKAFYDLDQYENSYLQVCSKYGPNIQVKVILFTNANNVVPENAAPIQVPFEHPLLGMFNTKKDGKLFVFQGRRFLQDCYLMTGQCHVRKSSILIMEDLESSVDLYTTDRILSYFSKTMVHKIEPFNKDEVVMMLSEFILYPFVECGQCTAEYWVDLEQFLKNPVTPVARNADIVSSAVASRVKNYFKLPNGDIKWNSFLPQHILDDIFKKTHLKVYAARKQTYAPLLYKDLFFLLWSIRQIPLIVKYNQMSKPQIELLLNKELLKLPIVLVNEDMPSEIFTETFRASKLTVKPQDLAMTVNNTQIILSELVREEQELSSDLYLQFKKGISLCPTFAQNLTENVINQKLIFNDKEIDDDELVHEIMTSKKLFSIMTGKDGTGKTTVIQKQILKPFVYWILYLNLDWHKGFKENTANSETFLKYLLKIQMKETDEEGVDFLMKILNQQNNQVLLVLDNYKDHLDNLDVLLGCNFRILFISKQPYNILKHLKGQCNDIRVKTVNFDDCKHLLIKKYGNDVNESIFQLIKSKIPEDLLSTPLQIQNFAVVFRECLEDIKQDKFCVVKLYKSFLIDHYINEIDTMSFICVKKMACKALLPPEILDLIHVDVDELKVAIAEFVTRYKRNTIVTKFHDTEPVFMHQTYAEFLCAYYLSEKVFRRKELYWRLWPSLYSNLALYNVRRYFDMIICENLPLHTAILNQDERLINSLMLNQQNINSKDFLGRTPLILALSYVENNFLRIENNKIEVIRISEDNLKNVLNSVKDWKSIDSIEHCIIDYLFLTKSLFGFKVLNGYINLQSLNKTNENVYSFVYTIIYNKEEDLLTKISSNFNFQSVIFDEHFLNKLCIEMYPKMEKEDRDKIIENIVEDFKEKMAYML
ncbi:uncharacterized protein LOC109606347 isoform X4 [Aethina tumida]|uniref:uncharacterized protein LOC109606347 isoform X2 n=1 Tax=Aethina tumida TaxID=116153 RepID=UPI00214967AD|nr:uncharacterized protein LOC109606347 isoform X2 [Aethina tumida]XP_049824420.1 uncharacterized protein LOC109606347 isoform X3 [Aethina tumida]XP_049824421.1 uncharacterized protein LOC109606347 isoform X4 [Aethina tumida]